MPKGEKEILKYKKKTKKEKYVFLKIFKKKGNFKNCPVETFLNDFLENR